MMTEVWRPVKGAEGLYEVSSWGRVKSLRMGRMLSATDNGHGYKIVALGTKNGKKQNRYVHRLVADAFLGGIPEGKEINHIDRDRSNNSLENLEVISHRQNVNHSREQYLTPHRSITNTGERYISYRNGAYRLTIRRRERIYKTLKEAVLVREVILSGSEYFAEKD